MSQHVRIGLYYDFIVLERLLITTMFEGQLPAQCYQIEWLLKVQGNKWSYKRSPNDWETFWAILKNIAVE